jgi:hypothetical protein
MGFRPKYGWKIGAVTPGRGVSKFFLRRGRPARSFVVARSPLRFGRGKFAYTLILFRAVNDLEADRGTTFLFLPGGPFSGVWRILRIASVSRLDTAFSVRLGFLEGLCLYLPYWGYTFRLLPAEDLDRILYPARSPLQAFSFAGFDFTIGLSGFPGRSTPDARLRGAEAFARPATDLSFDLTRFVRVTRLFWFPFLKGVLKRLSRFVEGLSPFVFWALEDSTDRHKTRTTRPSSFQLRAMMLIVFWSNAFKKWCRKQAKLSKICN